MQKLQTLKQVKLEQKRILPTNIKTKLSDFCGNCNTDICKTVSSNIMPVVNQKENKLYHIFAMKVGFSGLYFVFIVFLLISYLF